MSKDSVFSSFWRKELDEVEIHVSLAWDKTKSVTIRTWFMQGEQATEDQAIGELWRQYSQEIIAHIREKGAEK
jgi:hypothetical protein